MTDLLIATHNAGKLAEFRQILEPKGFRIIGAAEFGLPEPEETGTTFVENARLKAHAAVTATGLGALADDSGLEVDALGGAPGVYTADWATTPTGRDFAMAMQKLRDALGDAPGPWTARFKATLCWADPDGSDRIFEGAVEGEIVWPPKGLEGHGFDPCFQPAGHDATLGQMPAALKNSLSHRAVALEKLLAAL